MLENLKKKLNFKVKSKKKKWIMILVLLIVIVIVAFSIKGCSSNVQQGTMISTSKAVKMNVEEIVSLKGTVEGSESAEVTSALNYKILSIFVEEGDKVTKGQTLAVLDGDVLKQEYATAQNRSISAEYELQDKLKELQKSYDNEVRNANHLKQKYEGNQTLYTQGAISKEEFDKSEMEYKNAQSSVSSFQAINGKIMASLSQTKNLEIERDNAAQKKADLEDTNITSPIDGTITRVNAKIGRNAADTEDKKAMFVIENLENLQMNVNVGEFDISKIAEGQFVNITADVMGEKIVEGKVSRIAPSGEKKEGTNEMIIPVQIDIVQSDPFLIPGVSAKANIRIAKKENVLAVPVDAILENPEDESTCVFVMKKDQTLKKVPITVGVEGDFFVEIISGSLKEGDLLVLSPTHEMTNGMAVVLNPEQVK